MTIASNPVKGNSKSQTAKSAQNHQISLISGGGSSGNEKMLNGESVKILEQMDGYTLMVHEFLYLLCNTSDRLHQIEKNHIVDHK